MRQRTAIRDRFKAKVAIVTGGSSGIGRATVEELTNEGAAVAFTGLEEDDGVAFEKKLSEDGYDALYCYGDMADGGFCKGVVERTVSKWGGVDYLVNNAFSFVSRGLDATREDWDRILDVGPVAFATMAQSAAEPMKHRGGGAIVNISSVSAHIAQPNRWTYNAA